MKWIYFKVIKPDQGLIKIFERIERESALLSALQSYVNGLYNIIIFCINLKS
jgi:hypothetical protein